ncbi:MAG: sodium:solute symporter family protein [Bacteroidales bacterium]|nr:sodium:solute symporter family protein [Bacteroidales bacterium]MBN2698915.1 sodium:solute symporter family protein [Bacteroidales bacterium]
METTFNLGTIDWLIIFIYFVFVLGIGWALKKYMKDASAFLEAGRSLPAWVTGLAFISANLGALEVIGMAASGAKYGMMTVHFYWIGAIPAMIFLAIFMMPFYYGSKARSVPEYLKLRFDEKTRGFNAFAFAIMTVFSSGISMYALAVLAQVIIPLEINWHILGMQIGEFDFYLFVSALIVLVYMVLGGLTSAIYNEVLQFFLIVIGFAPLVIIGLIDIGGWQGLKEKLPENMIHTWSVAGSPDANPMGVEWFGILVGLGFVLSFGYWCTNFLVVQRAMAAGSMSAARKTPLIGAIPKMFIPFLVIIPGMIAVALTNIDALELPLKEGTMQTDFDKVIPILLVKYMPVGALGLGLTALMASFMSGMAGNVSAFNTVFTYDIYQSYIVPNKPDNHYLKVGRWTTVFGVLVSILTAYVARSFNNVMDFLQLIFAFINAPLFAAFLLGMFWKRTTGHAAFWGLIGGTVAAAIHHGLTLPASAAVGIKGGYISLIHTYPSEMAQNFWTAIYAFATCLILTIVITFLTKKLKTDDQLRGLVYSLTPKVVDDSRYWYQKPGFLAIVVGVVALALSIIFW